MVMRVSMVHRRKMEGVYAVPHSHRCKTNTSSSDKNALRSIKFSTVLDVAGPVMICPAIGTALIRRTNAKAKRKDHSVLNSDLNRYTFRQKNIQSEGDCRCEITLRIVNVFPI